MLRDAGVRTKLLAVLAIPTALLIIVTSILVAGQVASARRAGQVSAITSVAIQVNRVVHSLQQERSATLEYLQDPSAGNNAAMKGQRGYTNQQLAALRDLIATSPVDQMSPAVRAAVARSTAGHDEIAGARRSVDAGRYFATESDVFYTRVIRTDLDLPGVVASSGTPALAERLQAYGSVSTAIEYAAHERDLVEIALLRGSITESDFGQTSALVAQQRQALSDFQRNATSSAYNGLDNALAKSQNSLIDRYRRNLSDLLTGREPDFGGSVEWVGAANSRIGPMTQSESELVADIEGVASSTRNDQERQALLLVVLAVIGLGLALMLAVSLARRITRPLRRLTVAAGEIGDEMPRMVERMQTPGDGPGVVVEPIPVESNDEIGRLAEAFNSVNEVTVQVAQEQAALRSSIAEMFVNVARRNQVLLGRQLSQLDSMEAREEDPDVLDRLFKLDHLATRMRRNAESLLVLAGIDSTRRLRTSLPLSDVIRTAVGEIEAFDRIDLSMTEDPEVSGRHALTVAHLLAELLENATHFSNPETRVVVSASVTGHGVDLTVTDYGLGMSEEDVVAANERIAHPPVAEIAVSQRLGLFVVGRLASRLGATVVLRRGRSAGTVVAIGLPAGLFDGMSVPEPVEQEDASPVFDAADLASAETPGMDDDASVDVLVHDPADALAVDAGTDDSGSRDLGRGLFRRGRRRKSDPAPADDTAAQDAGPPDWDVQGTPEAPESAAALPDVDTDAEPVELELFDPVEPVKLAESAEEEPVAEVEPVLSADDTQPIPVVLVDAVEAAVATIDAADQPTTDEPSLVPTDAFLVTDGEPTDHAELTDDAVLTHDAVLTDDAAPSDERPARRRGLFGRGRNTPAAELAEPAESVADVADEADADPAEVVGPVEDANLIEEPVPLPVSDAVLVDDSLVFDDVVVADDVAAVDEADPVDEAAMTDEDAVEPSSDRPARRGLFGLGRRSSRSPDVANETAEADESRGFFESASADETDEVVAPLVESPVAQAEPEPDAPEVVEAPAAQVEPEPPVAGVEPEPAPVVHQQVVPIVYAPAVDVLPSRPTRGGGRFGRHRTPEPTAATAPAPLPLAPPPVTPPPPVVPVPAAPIAVTPVEPVPAAPPAVTAAPSLAAAPATLTAPSSVPAQVHRPDAPPQQAPFATSRPEAEPTQPPAVPVVPPREQVPAMSAALPTRSATADAVPAEPAPVDPGPAAGVSELERMTARSDLQSTALSELRGLYAPTFTPTPAPVAAEGLARRTPKAGDAPASEPAASAVPRRARNASDVRGMLSGFRAGVERGRGTAGDDAAGVPTDTDSDAPTS